MSIRIVFIALVAACLVGSLRAAAPQLPTNWQTDCSSEYMKEATSEDFSCADTLTTYKDPGEPSLAGLLPASCSRRLAFQ